jgi:hypothetical protein
MYLLLPQVESLANELCDSTAQWPPGQAAAASQAPLTVVEALSVAGEAVRAHGAARHTG